MVKNSAEEAKYFAIKWILEDTGFHAPEIRGDRLIFRDAHQEQLVYDKGITDEHIRRFIKEKNGANI